MAELICNCILCVQLDGEIGAEVVLVVGDVAIEVVELVAFQHTLITIVVEGSVILHLPRTATDGNASALVEALVVEQDVVPVVGWVKP